MPYLIGQPLSRRSFLTRSAAAWGAISIFSRARSSGALPSAKPGQLTLALLSDTHIAANPLDEFRKFLPTENLKKIVPQVIDSAPDGAILSGDAARLTGEPGDYGALQQLIAPITSRMPLWIALGNHDHRPNFLKAFPTEESRRVPIHEKHVLVLEHPVVRIIVLDSLLYVDKVAGLLGKAQRAWLSGYLPECDERPIAFFVHHTLGDGDGDLLDADRLFRLLGEHPKVKAIFFGHSHRFHIERRHSLHLINLPSTAYNFSDTEPVGWVKGVFSAKGVTLKLEALAGNRSRDGEVTELAWNR
jgi:3',5'-cyclic-AMP phosphodiesterase